MKFMQCQNRTIYKKSSSYKCPAMAAILIVWWESNEHHPYLIPAEFRFSLSCRFSRENCFK